MATSGNIDLVYSRDDIIQEAFEQIRVVEPGEPPEQQLIDSASRTLNMMVKAWQTKGLQIHTVVRRYLFAEPDTRQYIVDGNTARWVSSYVPTTILTTQVSGGNTVDLTDVANIVSGTLIGLYTDDQTVFWTSATGAPTGNTVPLADVIPSDITEGSTAYYYQTSDVAGRPMDIIEVWERNYNGNDRPLDQISRQEYSELTLKTNDGGIVSVFYDPQVNPPSIFIWPEHQDMRMILGCWVKRTIENFDVAADDADFPQEAFLALAFNLAMLLVAKMGTAPQTAQFVTQQAGMWFKNYMDYTSKPDENVQFHPFDEVEWSDSD